MSSKRNYNRIYSLTSNEQRIKLISLVQEDNLLLKDAAEMLNLNYSTAKSILRTFKKENRILKKPKGKAIFKIIKVNRDSRDAFKSKNYNNFSLNHSNLQLENGRNINIRKPRITNVDMRKFQFDNLNTINLLENNIINKASFDESILSQLFNGQDISFQADFLSQFLNIFSSTSKFSELEMIIVHRKLLQSYQA